MGIEQRQYQWDALEGNVFDVAIIGGGINGVCLYHRLCSNGFRVALLDKEDFAGATSQASAMMIWGGLLYLRNWDLPTVWRLCAARDRMLCEMSDWVKPRRFRYIPSKNGRRGSTFMRAALQFYWLLGGCRRQRPRREGDFSERAFLAPQEWKQSLVYEEASVAPSDARFVLHWLLPYQNGVQTALNYCPVEGGAFDRGARLWRLQVTDRITGQACRLRARSVVNAAGVWTDRLNDKFGLQSPYKHVMSKGVFIGLNRDPRHQTPLIFDTRDHADGMSLIPWGPVSLWGPTETVVGDPGDGFSVQPEDVRILLDELNPHLVRPVTPKDIVSLRCGVRPLAVDNGFDGNCNALDLSRRHRIHRDEQLPWISVYGGKLTNCVALAERVARLLGRVMSPGPAVKSMPAFQLPQPRLDTFPNLSERIIAADWCARHEMCRTLDDYLRRRTNVAQWVPRGGLGKHNENESHLVGLAKAFCDHDEDAARKAVHAYRHQIEDGFDRTLANC